MDSQKTQIFQAKTVNKNFYNVYQRLLVLVRARKGLKLVLLKGLIKNK